jgi:hypothetical protein
VDVPRRPGGQRVRRPHPALTRTLFMRGSYNGSSATPPASHSPQYSISRRRESPEWSRDNKRLIAAPPTGCGQGRCELPAMVDDRAAAAASAGPLRAHRGRPGRLHAPEPPLDEAYFARMLEGIARRGYMPASRAKRAAPSGHRWIQAELRSTARRWSGRCQTGRRCWACRPARPPAGRRTGRRRRRAPQPAAGTLWLWWNRLVGS